MMLMFGQYLYHDKPPYSFFSTIPDEEYEYKKNALKQKVLNKPEEYLGIKVFWHIINSENGSVEWYDELILVNAKKEIRIINAKNQSADIPAKTKVAVSTVATTITSPGDFWDGPIAHGQVGAGGSTPG